MRKKKIAFFGSSLLSAYWNGAATYYRGVLRTLHELGYEITFFEPDAWDRQKNTDIAPPPYASVVVYRPRLEAVAECLKDAQEADIIIKASGVGIFDRELEEGVLKLRTDEKQVIFWDVDAPATLDRLQNDPADPFRRLISKYDRILTYGGGDPVIRAYLAFGAADCTPIYNAFDPTTHHPAPVEERFRCDLAFLGNRLPDRERRVEELFLSVADEFPQKTFILGGSGWETRTLPPNVRYTGHVGTADHNAFNSSSLAVLNISRDSMASYGFSPATRIFEAAGAGSCIITDNWKGIDEFFIPEKEILVARDRDHLITLLRELTPARAQRIGIAARARALSHHTYRHRSMLLDKVLGKQQAIRT